MSITCAVSSLANMLGTSPVFKMLLMSSKNDSILIWVSLNKKTVGEPSPPALRRTFFRSSRHSTWVYDFVISIEYTSYSAMNAAILVSDWRPEPPTPTNSALPRSCRMTREIRQMCSAAYRNSTRSIRIFPLWLYSTSCSVTSLCRASTSFTSAYLPSAPAPSMKLANISRLSSTMSTVPFLSKSHEANTLSNFCPVWRSTICFRNSKNHIRSSSFTSLSWKTRRVSCDQSLMSSSWFWGASPIMETPCQTLLMSRML
mmetsp:Transcript_13481/g.52996  ORF Transcript_13481/g.52996 Transcript_13481/m.52996 type:complete len:258 (+) Transcript_13481:188-961(+)